MTRREIENLIEFLIALLDEIDGDSDNEPSPDSEPDVDHLPVDANIPGPAILGRHGYEPLKM